MKKLLVLLISIFILVGCTTSSSLTYDVSTGDKIKVKINTSDGFSFKDTKVPFTILKGEDQIEGEFGSASDYTNYSYQIVQHADQEITIIDQSENNSVEYIFYSWVNNGTTEYIYLIYIKGSDTCLQLSTTSSQSVIEKCFNNMTLTKE